MRNLAVHVVVCVVLIFSAVVGLSAAEKVTNAQPKELAAYKSSNNTVVRRNILFDISANYSKNRVAEQWHKDLVESALTDNDPTVVEAGIQTAMMLGFVDQTKSLIALYNTAYTRFPGYDERVQVAVIDALGVLGGSEAIALFKRFIENDNGSPTALNVIEAIGKTKATALIDVLYNYSNKMNKKVEQSIANQRDPIFYVQYKDYSRNALECARMLEAVKGGAQ